MEADHLLQIMEAIKAMDLSSNLVTAPPSHIPSQLLQVTVEVATAPVPLFSPDTVHRHHTPNHHLEATTHQHLLMAAVAHLDMVRRLLKAMATNNRVVIAVDNLHTLALPPVVLMLHRMDPVRVSKATVVDNKATAVATKVSKAMAESRALADPVIARHRDQATEVAVIKAMEVDNKTMVVANKVTAEVQATVVQPHLTAINPVM